MSEYQDFIRKNLGKIKGIEQFYIPVAKQDKSVKSISKSIKLKQDKKQLMKDATKHLNAVTYPNDWSKEDIDKFKSYYKRATKKNIAFELSVGFFKALTDGDCVYCGAIERIGIDRIDSKYGYTESNTQSVCCHCNMMKYVYSENHFLSHVSKICKHRNL